MTEPIVLSVDWLRAHAKMAHFFGLGFIQVKLDDRRRVHFYHPDLPAFVEEPHDHRYGFVSSVMRGTLLNRIWRVTLGNTHNISYENCRQDGAEVPSGYRGSLVSAGAFHVREGSGYHIHSETFHTVHPKLSDGPVVTLVEREVPFKDFAKVVRPLGAPPICPFSRPIPESEIWDVVRKCII